MSSTSAIQPAPEGEGIPEKRAKEFIRHALDLFDHSAKLSRAIYFDKTVSKSDISKSVGFGVGAIVGLALSYYIPEGGKLIGKSSGKLIAYVGGMIEQKIDLRKQKKIAKLLEDFDLADRKWKTILLNAFFDIFLNYNIQMIFLLCELSNMTDEKCMWKLAKDAVLRVFNDFENTTTEVLDQEQIVKSFIRGKSGEGFICDILHKMGISELGKTINVKLKGRDKEYKTSNLFEKLDVLFENQQVVLMKERTPGEFLYRRSFPFEDIKSFKLMIGWEKSSIHDLLDYQEHCRSRRQQKDQYDQYFHLTEIREEILSVLCSDVQQFEIEMTGIKEKLNEVANGLEKLGIEKQDTLNFIKQEMEEIQNVQKIQEIFIQELTVSMGEVKHDVEHLKNNHGNRIEMLELEMKELREYVKFLKLHIISQGPETAQEADLETRGKLTVAHSDYAFDSRIEEYFNPDDWLPKLADFVKTGKLHLPTVPSILQSVWVLKRDGQTKGTIFLVNIAELEGVFLFSAGQNFETDGSFENIDMKQFCIYPVKDNCNACGMNIQEDLMNKAKYHLVLGYEGQIFSKSRTEFNSFVKEELFEDDLQQDFFLLYLPDYSTPELKLGDLDKVFTSKVQDIEENGQGECVSIFGYTEPSNDITADIVLSFGVVEKNSEGGQIIFDAFTIETSCGAPAFGSNGNVLGIFLESFDEAEDGDNYYTIQSLGMVLERVKLFLPRNSLKIAG